MIQDKYKYNPYAQYGNELENIIEQKQWDTDISKMLKLAFPIMVEHYGYEYKDILLNTLRNINIERPLENESMYDIVKKYTPRNIQNISQISAVNEGELKRASGVHNLSPVFEIKDGKPVLIGRSEVVSVKENKNNMIERLANFVHELSHAIKSNQNSMKLLEDEEENQFLVTRSGLSVVYSKVYIENGKIIVEDIKENNIGMEEGINTLDENIIINKILCYPIDKIPPECQDLRASLKLPESKTEYVSSAYVQETLCADKLLNKCKLKEVVRKDQLIGTVNCEKVYDNLDERPENNWKSLNEKVDLSVKHTYERYKHIGDSMWLHENISDIMENLKEIHEMLDESSKNRNIIDLNK